MSAATIRIANVGTLVLVLLLAACCPPPAAAVAVAGLGAAPYPAGDRLFRGDARWLGGDAAYSVPIDAERRLWLFGDSFIALDASRSRAKSKLVRNTLGLQRGVDVREASMRFFHGGNDAAPSAFFASRGERWYWPGPAAQLSPSLLLLTLFELEKQPGDALGFRAVASEARLMSPGAHDDPSSWSTQRIELPATPWGVLLGTGALLVDGGYVYNYAVVEPGNHDVYLARWPLERAQRGDLGDPQWWDGATFRGQAELLRSAGRPRLVATAAQTELSVHRDPNDGGGVVMVHTIGFGQTSIGLRRAPRLTGPFDAPTAIARPDESARDGVLVYAAKAHASLVTPDGAVLITYATNHRDFATLVADQSLYYPRFFALHAR
ncbi:MAG: hypothetical protein KC503_12495 [Myxococcales bacterium]|nr:hypothetical protein [Myxococcales bacterium]